MYIFACVRLSRLCECYEDRKVNKWKYFDQRELCSCLPLFFRFPILRYSTFFVVLLFWFPCCPLVSSLPSIFHRIPVIIVKKNVLLTNDIPNCTLEYSSLALGKVRVQVTQAQNKTRKPLSLFGRGLSAKDFDVTNWTVLTMGTWNFQLLWRDIDFTSWLHCGEN